MRNFSPCWFSEAKELLIEQNTCENSLRKKFFRTQPKLVAFRPFNFFVAINKCLRLMPSKIKAQIIWLFSVEYH